VYIGLASVVHVFWANKRLYKNSTTYHYLVHVEEN